jgi:hypothetical protein
MIGIYAVLLIVSLFYASVSLTQTVENPIEIYMNPLEATLAPGQSSALTITFRIPQGFWLGDNNRSARIPSATVIEMQKQKYFVFEQPRFPEPEVRGVPVHLGLTRVFTGEVKVIVPFKITETLWHPFVGSTENNGQSIGAAMALMNVTREGIMTGTFDIRGYYNENVGGTVAVDVVSCPAAYSNYWFSAQISDDRYNQ